MFVDNNDMINVLFIIKEFVEEIRNGVFSLLIYVLVYNDKKELIRHIYNVKCIHEYF